MKMGGSLGFAAVFFTSLALYQAFFSIPAAMILRLFGAEAGYGEEHVGGMLLLVLLFIPVISVGLSTLCARGLRRNRKALQLLTGFSILAYAVLAYHGNFQGAVPKKMFYFAPLLVLLFVALAYGFLRIMPRSRPSSGNA